MGLIDDTDRALLRWSDAASAVSHEQFVEIVEARLSEAVLGSTCEIPVDTKVRLIGRDYTGEGTVRSCRSEGTLYKLSLSMGEELPQSTQHSTFDPGLFAVENFLTEEQEAKILKDLEDDERNPINFFSYSYPSRILARFTAFIGQQRIESVRG